MSNNDILRYKIDCGPGGNLSGQDIWLKSFDPIYSNYLFKLKKCIGDHNGNYYVYIKNNL